MIMLEMKPHILKNVLCLTKNISLPYMYSVSFYEVNSHLNDNISRRYFQIFKTNNKGYKERIRVF